MNERRRMSWGEAFDRIGVWAIAVIAGWVGYTIIRLSDKVDTLNNKLTEVITNDLRDRKDMDIMKTEIQDLYELNQWTIETFHGKQAAARVRGARK